eukprot:3607802-Prymnesium_polylepis.1
MGAAGVCACACAVLVCGAGCAHLWGWAASGAIRCLPEPSVLEPPTSPHALPVCGTQRCCAVTSPVLPQSSGRVHPTGRLGGPCEA